MGRLGVTRGGWVAVGAASLAVAATGAFAGQQYADRVELGATVPAPGSAVASSQPLLAIETTRADGLRDLEILVDGKDRTAQAARSDDGQIVVSAGKLPDGEHRAEVRFRTNNVFSRSVSRSWSFTVDTKLPDLALAQPKAGAEVAARALKLTGKAEPASNVTVNWKGGSTATVAGPAGNWSVSADLPEGRVALRVTAADRAGNAAVASRTITVDATAPKLTLAKLPAATIDTDAPTLYGTLAGETPARAIVGAIVNGREVRALPGATGFDDKGNPVAGVTFTGRQFALSVGRMPQGRNTVKVFVRDPAGNRSEKTVKLVVDSTEELGSVDLVPGARGEDVKELQRQLVARGFKRTKVTGVYDPQTARGVRNYQRVRGIKQSGVFGVKTRQAFVGRLVVSLGKFRVALVRDGKVVVSYPIAHGTPRYPTPTGTFEIVNKQSNPTWTPPPDSDWAKGLGPIPPGPGNPLGTRWMGTSAQYVGIHGTPAAGTIGTRASHGCIRMKIPDAEALYEHVVVGMPVQIRA